MTRVPEDELIFTAVRSGGPGGQNVNKVATKVVVRWSYLESSAYTDLQKELLTQYQPFAGRVNSDGEFVFAVQEERSQLRNREILLERLNELVAAALKPKKKRRPTKVSKAQVKKRLDQKAKASDKKVNRKYRPNRE